MSKSKKPPAGDLVRDAIRAALAEQGITQLELARRAGMGPVHVSRFLRGRRDVTTRVANRMLAALGLEVK
jgi:transcriptional regulator with XRE-family HTH domain